jgi:acylphosphatase
MKRLKGNSMRRLTAYVSGKVQKSGYRARVVQMANALRLSGAVENLADGRVKIIAEGDEDKLRWFEEAIDIKNTLIQVSSIEKEYSDPTGDFAKFYKLVEAGETDSRLDTAADYLKELISEVKDMNKNLGSKIDGLGGKIDGLGGKIDGLGGKMDQMLIKQDRSLEKQDELLVEVKDMNRNLSDKADLIIKKQDDLSVVKSDIAEIKTALKAKGIM